MSKIKDVSIDSAFQPSPAHLETHFSASFHYAATFVYIIRFFFQYSYGWAVFLWFHVNFTHVMHNMSIWYSLVLAVWRLIMIRLRIVRININFYAWLELRHFSGMEWLTK